LVAIRSSSRDPGAGRLPIVYAIGLNAFGWQSRDGRENDVVELEFVSRQHLVKKAPTSSRSGR
jgi:hypothetical protein